MMLCVYAVMDATHETVCPHVGMPTWHGGARGRRWVQSSMPVGRVHKLCASLDVYERVAGVQRE